MVSSGMKDAGYQYIVIDDCWQVGRDAEQHRPRSPALNFGIYSDAGKKLAPDPGSMGHEYQDALSYAKWGVDYLKYDRCHTGKRNAEEAYATMRDALNASGRPILFSMCEWGTAKPWLWAQDICNQWRTTGTSWTNGKATGNGPDGSCCELGMLDILDLQVGLDGFAGPGHWNDPDMLEVGTAARPAANTAPLQPLVYPRRAAYRRQRSPQHDARDQGNPHQQGSYRHRLSRSPVRVYPRSLGPQRPRQIHWHILRQGPLPRRSSSDH
jgi:Alpha galactosidase A